MVGGGRGKTNWGLIGSILAVATAVVSPFFAVGEFKGRTMNRLEALESKALAAEIEVKSHEDKDIEKYIEVQKKLTQLEYNSNSTISYLKTLDEKQDRLLKTLSQRGQ